MVKEYETSHAAAESAGTNATDINNLGNAPFNTEADRIWITYIGSDEVRFATSFFPTHSPQNCEERCSDSSGIDKSKPFFVRVNKTVWQPTRVNVMTEPDQAPGQETRWNGEIFGLAPMSNYKCEFISTVDGTVLFSTSVRTLQPRTDISAAGIAPNPHVPGRPGSPATTLRTSIASSEIKLAEERNRQKRERKDQRAKQHSVRKELEKLNGTISSAGSNDDRLRQKIHQSNLHMKQAEEAFLALEAQIQSLDSVPAVDESEYKSSKAAYQSQREQHKQERADFNAAKLSAEQETQAMKNEIASLEQKRERMQARIAKLNGEHERITDANARGLDEAQRKASERQRKAAERMNMEMMLTERLQSINGQIDAITLPLQELAAVVQSMQVQEMEMYHAAQAMKNEIASLEQKRERMQARIAKLNGEHERITDANARGLDEAQRKASERQRKAAERMNMEMMLTERLQSINGQIDAITLPLQELAAVVQSMQVQEMEMYHAAQAGSPTTSLPNSVFGVGDIPEGNVPVSSNYPWNPQPNAGLYGPAIYGTGMFNSPSSQGLYKRGRSSSMHSNISGFTQSSGEGPMLKPNFSRWVSDERAGQFESIDGKDSSGSASRSGSGAGSVGDPKSPLVEGNAKPAVKWGSGVWDDK
jgi:peptidoglycan hydrolase CwlO-like protein